MYFYVFEVFCLFPKDMSASLYIMDNNTILIMCIKNVSYAMSLITLRT